jgi:serine/threonine protein kinase
MPIQPGTQLGAFILEESIGRGSLGPVYRARHQAEQRTAVVKLLQPLAGDPDAKTRFRNEMQAVGRLRHPNILTIYEYGEFEGVPYLIEEYAPGGRLADRISAGRRLDRRAAIGLLRGVGAALDHAHSVGVLHGDVNPANVMLGYNDTPLLGDFGLARLLQPDPSPGSTAVPSGDPAYMAPERVNGSAVGPAADNYSFAAMAYELLTGRVPFAGQSGLEQLYSHVHRDPPPPSSIDSSLLRGVDAVLLAGLAKDPGRRWPSCVEMVDALEAALGGAQIDSVAVDQIEEERRPNRLPLWIGLGALALVLIALLAFFVIRSRSSSPILTLSQDTVKAGDMVTVSGQNLPPNQLGTVEVQSSRQQVGNFRADSTGNFQTVVTIPADYTPGSHQMLACWSGSCPASASINDSPSPTPTPSPSSTPTPTPPPSTPTPTPPPPPTAPPTPVFNPQITGLSTTVVKPGGSIRVFGTGFDPTRPVVIQFQQNNQTISPINSPLRGPAANGTISIDATIPSSAEAGQAFILACIGTPSGSTGACSQPQQITVQKP